MKLKLIKGMRLVAATHNPGKAREIAATSYLFVD